MKSYVSLSLMMSMLCFSATVFSDSSTTTTTSSGNTSAGTSTEDLLTNLGTYLGFDLNSAASTTYAELFDVTNSIAMQQSTLYTLFGSLPVNAFSTAFAYFVPKDSSYSAINNRANSVFSSVNYNSTSSSDSSSSNYINVNAYVDQSSTSTTSSGTYMSDPVSQYVLNILGTPHFTFCMDNDAASWVSDCDYLYDKKVLDNVIGTYPKASEFFTYSYNAAYIPQLNANTLIAPLLYNTTSGDTSASSSSELTASNQAQEAANFIRYVTRSTNINLPTYSDYNDVYTAATYSVSSSNTEYTTSEVADAQISLDRFLSNMRSFAAISSIPASNLYYIYAKRLPQTQTSSDSSTSVTTSQALNEYLMATRRIYNPKSTDQWATKLDSASTATVQKEIALLLSEINYQLYLNRQLEERILLTQTANLIAANKDTPSLETENSETNNSDETSTDTSSESTS